MLTAAARLDLSSAPRDRQRHRVDALRHVPDGARAIVLVGALAPEPAAVRVLVEHEARLSLDIQGEPRSVRLWYDAVATGGDCLPLRGAV